MGQMFINLIEIHILRPNLAYINLTIVLSGPSGLVLIIQTYKILKVEISLANTKITKTESKTECCQILVRKVLTQYLYINQIRYKWDNI